MCSVVFVVPGRLETRTGGSLYNRHMVEGLRSRGWVVGVRELHESFPCPTDAALNHAACVLAEIPSGKIVLIDSLAVGVMPAVIERQASRLRIVALVHLPLARDISIDRNVAFRFRATESRALNAAALVVATGAATLPMLADYGIEPDRIRVVEPGTRRASIARGSRGTALQLLSVATLNPLKGHAILLEALAAIPHVDWHLTCAGSLTRHPATVEQVIATMSRLRVSKRVSLVGDLDTGSLLDCYDRADVFVLATLQETYGMAVAEALSHGLPVVSTTTGAIPDLVGNDAGLLVPPGDTEALTTALARILGDTDLRTRLGSAARRVRDRIPSWEEAAGRMAAALESLETYG